MFGEGDRPDKTLTSLLSDRKCLESAVLIFLMLYFKKISLSDNFEITTSIVVPCGGPKSIPVHRFRVVIFTFSGPMGL